jgi:hypothetical protein
MRSRSSQAITEQTDSPRAHRQADRDPIIVVGSPQAGERNCPRADLGHAIRSLTAVLTLCAARGRSRPAPQSLRRSPATAWLPTGPLAGSDHPKQPAVHTATAAAGSRHGSAGDQTAIHRPRSSSSGIWPGNREDIPTWSWAIGLRKVVERVHPSAAGGQTAGTVGKVDQQAACLKDPSPEEIPRGRGLPGWRAALAAAAISGRPRRKWSLERGPGLPRSTDLRRPGPPTLGTRWPSPRWRVTSPAGRASPSWSRTSRWSWSNNFLGPTGPGAVVGVGRGQNLFNGLAVGALVVLTGRGIVAADRTLAAVAVLLMVTVSLAA